MKKDRKSTLISILLLFFLAALMMIRQLMSQAYFSCVIQDAFEYTGWAWQFIEALKEGIIYPRWMPLEFWGYGGPIFVLYPPLAYYIAAFFSIFTGSVITAMNITKFLALFLSGVGMFFLIKEFYSEKIALLTASFFIIFPYIIFYLYFMGAFASVFSFVWFAPVILFTYRYIRNRQYKNLMYASLCYGGLILTHLVYAYMFSYVLIAFMLYISVIEKRLRDLTIMPLIVIIGVVISSAYILPLVYERQFINLEIITREGYNFAYFFILPNLTDRFPPGSVWPVYYNTFLLHMLLFITLTLLFSFQIVKNRQAIKGQNTHIITIFFIGTALCSMFPLFGISTFIWKTVPYFKYISFPYRWLSITAFAIVSLSASIFWILEHTYKTKRWNKVLLASLFLICLLLDYKYISSATFFSEESLIPVKVENWVTKEYLPKLIDVEKIDKNENFKENIVEITGEGELKVIQWKSAERIVEIAARKPLTVRIRTFYFPGWEAYLDGVQTAIKKEQGTGAMLIDIPEGKHRLVLKFEDTPVRYYAKIISLVSLFIIMILLLLQRMSGIE